MPNSKLMQLLSFTTFTVQDKENAVKGSKNRNRRVGVHISLVTVACMLELPTTLCMHTCQGLTIAAHVTLRRRTTQFMSQS